MDAQRIAQDGGARGTKRTVLLAEDNSALADVISLAIGGLAEELVVVSDGVKALDYLFRTGPHEDQEPAMPRLVLMDLGMPRMGGLEALERLRSDESTRRSCPSSCSPPPTRSGTWQRATPSAPTPTSTRPPRPRRCPSGAADRALLARGQRAPATVVSAKASRRAGGDRPKRRVHSSGHPAPPLRIHGDQGSRMSPQVR